MPINNATTNFGFDHISGQDNAGHNSINGLITSVDIELYAKVAVPGMIMLFMGVAAPTGWEELTSLTTPTDADMNTAFLNPGETLPVGVIWIKKKV
jgi:hypothetical protein